MNTFEFIVLILVIILAVCLVKKKEHEEYQNKVKENREFEIDCVHQENKNILEKCGEDQFIKCFGKDQLAQVKNGTDTRIVTILK